MHDLIQKTAESDYPDSAVVVHRLSDLLYELCPVSLTILAGI